MIDIENILLELDVLTDYLDSHQDNLGDYYNISNSSWIIGNPIGKEYRYWLRLSCSGQRHSYFSSILFRSGSRSGIGDELTSDALNRGII